MNVAYQCPGHGRVQEDAGDDGGGDDQPGPGGQLPQPLGVPGPEGEGRGLPAQPRHQEGDQDQDLGREWSQLRQSENVTSSLNLKTPWIEMSPL